MNDDTSAGPPEAPRAGRRWLVLLVAAATLAAALVFAMQLAPELEPEPPAGTAAVEPEVAPPPEPEQVAAVPEAIAVDPVPEAAPIDPVPEEEAAPDAAAEAPGFDLVRVAPDGGTVVAGHAAPGATVTIYADAVPLAEVEADRQGNFVAIFRAEPAEVPQTLTLGAVAGGGNEVLSQDVVLLLPETPAAAAVAAVEEPAAVAPDAPPSVPAAIGPPRPRVAATAIVRSDGVEVVEAGAPPEEPAAPRQVSLASISYAEDGAVMLAGLGTAGARLRAYVDDGFAEEGEVGGDGRWSLGLGDVGVGLYRLRIDQIDTEGEVASRVETPFQRDLPRGPLPRPGAPGERPVQVTVQPGTNLWTLARVHYGAGVLYSQIFTANQHLIRDPDLIYPGQIFDLPEVDAAP